MTTSPTINQSRLFLIGNLAIFMIGLGFAVRANIASDLQSTMFDFLDLANSASLVGEVLGATFIGFALTLLFGSALVDYIGMKSMFLLAALGFIVGSVLVIVASAIPISMTAYWLVKIGLLMTGFGWGAVEAASNPMIAALFPQDKTHRLNMLHAWWPAGIVVGGLTGVGMGSIDLPWQLNLLLLLIPASVLAYLVISTQFPVTERVAAGISHRDMYMEIFRSPGFLFWFACMLLTATSELAPGQWVDLALSHVVGMKGILLLVYVSALMFVMRHFAGPIAHRISPVGLLWFSSLFAAIGLYSLSLANNPMTALLAATLWGIGVCYMWPTMLACASERYPRGGAFFMGLMGFAGGLAIQFVLPQMGAIFDRAKIEAAGGLEQLQVLSGEQLEPILRVAAVESFQAVVLAPVVLLFIFAAIWMYDSKKGGAK